MSATRSVSRSMARRTACWALDFCLYPSWSATCCQVAPAIRSSSARLARTMASSIEPGERPA